MLDFQFQILCCQQKLVFFHGSISEKSKNKPFQAIAMLGYSVNTTFKEYSGGSSGSLR
jgi:hypothetical protein